jgi:hypothetical protein
MNKDEAQAHEEKEPLLQKEEKEDNEEPPKSSTPIWIFSILLLLIALAFSFIGKVTKKGPKRLLREKYQVNEKTFNKWIEIFCSSVIDYGYYKKRRFLTDSEVAKIESILGIPENGISVYSKREIIEKTESTYEVFRLEIAKRPDHYGITPSVFKSLDYYPPKIAIHFIRCLNAEN